MKFIPKPLAYLVDFINLRLIYNYTLKKNRNYDIVWLTWRILLT